jgi:hypothetical protein
LQAVFFAVYTSVYTILVYTPFLFCYPLKQQDYTKFYRKIAQRLPQGFYDFIGITTVTLG